MDGWIVSVLVDGSYHANDYRRICVLNRIQDHDCLNSDVNTAAALSGCFFTLWLQLQLVKGGTQITAFQNRHGVSQVNPLKMSVYMWMTAGQNFFHPPRKRKLASSKLSAEGHLTPFMTLKMVTCHSKGLSSSDEMMGVPNADYNIFSTEEQYNAGESTHTYLTIQMFTFCTQKKDDTRGEWKNKSMSNWSEERRWPMKALSQMNRHSHSDPLTHMIVSWVNDSQ